MEIRMLNPKAADGNGLLYWLLVIAAASGVAFSALAIVILTGLF
jgi:hypothetical protein